jgi:hypothetical protein
MPVPLNGNVLVEAHSAPCGYVNVVRPRPPRSGPDRVTGRIDGNELRWPGVSRAQLRIAQRNPVRGSRSPRGDPGGRTGECGWRRRPTLNSGPWRFRSPFFRLVLVVTSCLHGSRLDARRSCSCGRGSPGTTGTTRLRCQLTSAAPARHHLPVSWPLEPEGGAALDVCTPCPWAG